MSSMLEDSVKPVCPHKTGDVVRLVRVCSDSLVQLEQSFSSGSNLVETVITQLRDGMSSISEGVILCMVQRIEVSKEEIDLRTVWLDVVPFGGSGGIDFGSVENALKKDLYPDFGQSNSYMKPNNITIVASVILTNSETSSGQLSHPRVLTEELDGIQSACASIDSAHQSRFLQALETACLRAQRAGAKVAGVAVRESAGRTGLEVEFEPIIADSDDIYRGEELRRRQNGETCMRIPVRQHDLPR